MKTNKRYYFLSAALVTGIAMMMTACVANNDNAAVPGDPDTIEDFEEPEKEPTADALEVVIQGTTFVFDGNYTGDGKALVDRVKDCAASLTIGDTPNPNEDIQNIILHNSQIGNMTNGELAALIMVMTKGGSVVVADPTIEMLEKLVKGLRTIITYYHKVVTTSRPGM